MKNLFSAGYFVHFYMLLCVFSTFFMFFCNFIFAQKIKSDNDFMKKLTLYKGYLHQDWELVENKEIDKMIAELDAEKKARDFFLPIITNSQNQIYLLQSSLKQIWEKTEDSLREAKDKIPLRMIFNDKELNSNYTFFEAKKIFEERRKQHYLQKGIPDTFYGRRYSGVEDEILKKDTVLGRCYNYLLHRKENYQLRLTQEDYELLPNPDDYGLYFRINYHSSSFEIICRDDFDFSCELKMTSKKDCRLYHYIDDLSRGSQEFKDTHQKIKTIYILNYNLYQFLSFREDEIIFKSDEFKTIPTTNITKCLFTLMRSGKKYLDLYYGESPLNFYRIEILELTKEKLVLGACDNPDFIFLNNCIYKRKTQEN